MYLENFDFAQCLHMDMHGYLGLEFLRQYCRDGFLIHSFVVEPKVVEPLDDSCFQLTPDLWSTEASVELLIYPNIPRIQLPF